MEELWRCDCPICRLTVKPVLRILSRRYSLGRAQTTTVESAQQKQGTQGKNIEELAKKYPVQKVKVPTQSQQSTETNLATPQPIQQPTTQLPQNLQTPQVQITQQLQQTLIQNQAEKPKEEKEEKKEERKEERQQTVRVEVPKEVMERISSLETEIDKIKKYVKLSIDSIKATLVDLRSAMAELSNPFNILRKYADIFFGEEGEREKKGKGISQTEQSQQNISSPGAPLPYIPIVIPAMPQQMMSFTQQNMGQQYNINNDIGKNIVENKNTIGKESEESSVIETRPRLSFEVYEKLVLWANNVLNKIERGKFAKLIDYYVDIGVLTEDIGKALKKIVELVDELRGSGIDPKEQIRLLRDLVSGIDKTSRYKKIDQEYTTDYEEYQVSSTSKKKEPEASEAAKELLDLIEGGG